MPSGPRIRTNNVFGTVSDNPLTNVATTLNSNGLADLAAVSSAHAVLVLDPLRTAGAPEIVIVTAHTGSATSATITRGAYGTSARQHAQGTLWVHAPTIDDVIRIVTTSTRPSDPYEGQHIYETDTNRDAVYDGAAWLPGGFVVVCTSSTRPASPYEGQVIYESDTDKAFVWNGSTWTLPKNVAGGTLGYAQVTSNQGSITSEVDLTSLTLTVTTLASRRYKISGQCYYSNSGSSGTSLLKIYEDGSQIMEGGHTNDANAKSAKVDAVRSPSAGSHTWKLRGQATAGTSTLQAGATFPAFILVEDIGSA